MQLASSKPRFLLYLRAVDDVDISIDFPIKELYDRWRKKEDLFENAIKAIERCKKYNINVSIVSVLMANNFDYFQQFKPLLDKYDVNLRINLYKAVNKDEFTPSYDQFWEAIKTMGNNFEVVSRATNRKDDVLAVGGVYIGGDLWVECRHIVLNTDICRFRIFK